VCGIITGRKWLNLKKGTFFAGFVNEVGSAKKVGILRQRACDGKVKNNWVFFSEYLLT
jgi:hypothetical protein